MKRSQGEAHGKLILLGEHSVVYGYPALAMPLVHLKAKCTLSEAEITEENSSIKDHVTFESQLGQGSIEAFQDHPFYTAFCVGLAVIGKGIELQKNPTSATNELQPHFDALLLDLQNLQEEQKLNLSYIFQNFPTLKNRQFHIELQSEIPLSRGLGSSASTSIALLRAVLKHFEHLPLCTYTQTENALYTLAFFAEKVAHQNPSGVDLSLALQHQSLVFQKTPTGTKVTPFPIQAKAYLLLIDSDILGSTKEAVQKVSEHPEAKTLLQQLGECTQNVLHLFTEAPNYTLTEKEQIQKLGEAFSKAHQILKALGVSHAVIDQALEDIQSLSLGGKMSGGGLGGVCFALFDDLEKLNQAKQILQSRFNKMWTLPLFDSPKS